MESHEEHVITQHIIPWQVHQHNLHHNFITCDVWLLYDLKGRFNCFAITAFENGKGANSVTFSIHFYGYLHRKQLKLISHCLYT